MTGRRRQGADGRDPAINGSGFTLIELTVALALFAIGLIAAAGGIAMVTSSDTDAKERSHAVALAVQKLEELRGRPPAAVKSESVRSVDAEGEENKGSYKRSVQVVDGAEGPNTKAVTVSVEFPSSGGTKTIDVTTLVHGN